MTKETKRVLNIIDEALVGASTTTRRELWNILTALRGPDNDEGKLKANTTARIRSAAFPLTAKAGYPVSPALFRAALKSKPMDLTGSTRHFKRHIMDAAKALRMKVDDGGFSGT